MVIKPSPIRVRLKGLPALVKRLQEQVQGGAFLKAKVGRENTRLLLETVHNRLRQLNATPDDMTPASGRAYRQLLALQDVTLKDGTQAIKKLRLVRRRLRGISALVQALQADLAATAPGSPQAAHLAEEIHRLSDSIGDLCRQKGILPQDLAPESGTAYAWLVFLAQPGVLERHLGAIQRFNQAQQAPVRGRQALPVQATFFDQAAKFHWIRSPKEIHIQLHEAFIDAPEEVFKAAAMLVRGSRSKNARGLVNAWALSPGYLAICRELADIRSPAGGWNTDPRLLELFNQLNQQYFSGRLAVPRLDWSSRLAYRTLGTYAPSSDTITISRIFRDRELPAFLFEFVLFHEMLHQDLGSQVSGSRQMSHTAEFRWREAAYPGYRPAQEYLHSEAWLGIRRRSGAGRQAGKKIPPGKRGRVLF